MKNLKNKRDGKDKLEIFGVDERRDYGAPLFESTVSAGFPSPADDYMDIKLDLNKYLIKHPSATFYVKVKGNSMLNAGICDGDILIVDRAMEVKSTDICVCVVDGEFTVKRIKKIKNRLFLMADNPDYEPIEVTEENNFQIWGVVSYVIHKT